MTLSLATIARAASLTPELSTTTLHLDDQVFVDVVATTDGASINSVEATVRYPTDVLQFVGYQDGFGVIKFWITPPQQSGDSVHFVGGIPGGVSQLYGDASGATIPIVRLIFKTITSSAKTGTIAIEQSTLLLNDGKGSALPHKNGSVAVTTGTAVATSSGSPAEGNITHDMTPPLPFQPVILPKDTSSGTPMMLSFATQDTESGIVGYKVKIGFRTWQDATSPLPVKKGIFPKKVFIQAVDGLGNAQTASAYIPGVIPLWAIITIAIITVAGVWCSNMIKNRL